MIGVLVNAAEEELAREFFELFKTPWEFCRPGQAYDVVLCTRDESGAGRAGLLLWYHSGRLAFDEANRIPVKASGAGTALMVAERPLPLYGPAATFPENPLPTPRVGQAQESLTHLTEVDGGVVVRIGYDLFGEIHRLLTAGQPPANAQIPALELHIALLRDLITGAGQPLVEIPPVPAGHGLMACLTHDLDHPRLRNHWLDHTMFGFLARATAGALADFFRGRKSFANLARNWWAAVRLPLVYLGLAPDPWRGFDRYLQLEAGLGGTYFVIPERDYAGRETAGPAPAKRAARYTVEQIRPELEKILAQGGELGLHGLDAWLDPARGKTEAETLARTLGVAPAGVRMHWLFFNEQSPAILEQAGFSYDSSVGYNETVGFRAGTAQAYQPPGAARLLELPLQVMDTALFFPGFMNLSESEAGQVVSRLLKDVERFGGALTINWHDRSIAPERLWGDFYVRLLGELKTRRAWCPTAAQAVAWFRQRRSVRFESVNWEAGGLKLQAAASEAAELPGLLLRVHPPSTRKLTEQDWAGASAAFQDFGFKANGATVAKLPLRDGENN